MIVVDVINNLLLISLSIYIQGIVNCPFVPKKIVLNHQEPQSNQTQLLVRLFYLRGMTLLESGHKDLALVAINHALSLQPTSILCHLFKAKILNQLDRNHEAYHLIKKILHYYSCSKEEEDVNNLKLLKTLYKTLSQKIVEQKQQIDDAQKLKHLEQSQDSIYNSDKDNYDDINDEYRTPLKADEKNFSFDYRCNFFLESTQGEKGRNVVAEETIPENTTIFREKPYSLIILPEQQLHRCHYCAREVKNRFWPCSNCNQMVYCGERCAEEDWQLGHRFDCCLTNVWSGKTQRTLHVFKMINRVGVQNVLQLIQYPQILNYDMEAYRTDLAQRTCSEVKKTEQMLTNSYLAMMSLFHHAEKYNPDYMANNLTNAIECAVIACLVQSYGKFLFFFCLFLEYF